MTEQLQVQRPCSERRQEDCFYFQSLEQTIIPLLREIIDVEPINRKPTLQPKPYHEMQDYLPRSTTYYCFFALNQLFAWMEVNENE